MKERFKVASILGIAWIGTMLMLNLISSEFSNMEYDMSEFILKPIVGGIIVVLIALKFIKK